MWSTLTTCNFITGSHVVLQTISISRAKYSTLETGRFVKKCGGLATLRSFKQWLIWTSFQLFWIFHIIRNPHLSAHIDRRRILVKFGGNLYWMVGNKSYRFHQDRNMFSGVASYEFKKSHLFSNFRHDGETFHPVDPRRIFTRQRLFDTRRQWLGDLSSIIFIFGAVVSGRETKFNCKWQNTL